MPVYTKSFLLKKKIKAYYLTAIREPKRVLTWKQRHNLLTGKTYSWLEAIRATYENPPCFDSYWDDEIEVNYK